jgi:hypothetical protein
VKVGRQKIADATGFCGWLRNEKS